MSAHNRDHLTATTGQAIVVEVRPLSQGGHELVLDAQFDGDPFLAIVRRHSLHLHQLAPGQLIGVRRLPTGEVIVADTGHVHSDDAAV